MKTVGMNEQELQYLAYIDEHIATVQMVWDAFQKNLSAEHLIADDFNFFTLKNLIAKHDASKKSPEEFHGYRVMFYPDSQDCLSISSRHAAFEQAWNHHQKVNQHHWEHWVLLWGCELKPLPMPCFCILEMLMDWTAMGLVVGHQKPSDWYSTQVERMTLHDSTQATIGHWLPTFDEIYSDLEGLWKPSASRPLSPTRNYPWTL